MKPLLILQTGSTYPALQRHYGDFPDWIRQGLGDRTPVTVVDARESEFLPGAAGFSGVVITGSHHMVTDEAGWMRRLMHWLEGTLQLAEAPPLLGICFGHQILAHTLGGEVGDHPQGMEVGPWRCGPPARPAATPCWRRSAISPGRR